MTWFYLKKNFCDGWDNLLSLGLYNLIILAEFALTYFVFFALYPKIPILAFVMLVIGFVFFIILLFAVATATQKFSAFKTCSIKDVFLSIKTVYKTAIIFAFFLMIILFMIFVGLPFYFSFHNMIGFFIAAIIFWALIVTTFSTVWFIPLFTTFGGSFWKNLKKSYLLFFDNTGFSLFLGIYSLFLFVISFILAFLVPSFSGVLLAHHNALRLRLYKYDWLETQDTISPKEARKNIPWDELLFNDKEALGPRDFKSFIFPWK